MIRLNWKYPTHFSVCRDFQRIGMHVKLVSVIAKHRQLWKTVQRRRCSVFGGLASEDGCPTILWHSRLRQLWEFQAASSLHCKDGISDHGPESAVKGALADEWLEGLIRPMSRIRPLWRITRGSPSLPTQKHHARPPPPVRGAAHRI
jgi:hypothetical protein